ncbi:MAG: hypothetical protein ABJB61_00785 [bacterium]
MPTNPEDRVPRTGLWKVVIYEDERFVRTEKEYIVISEAEQIAKDFNGRWNSKAKAAGK